MAHLSEDTKKLDVSIIKVASLSQLSCVMPDRPEVYLFRFPFPRNICHSLKSTNTFDGFAKYLNNIHESSTVCILTTPPDAAILLPRLERYLKFQLWIAVKTKADAYPAQDGAIPHQHAALLVLTKYKGSLRHTKTRIKYTFCPACGKTTKDYGGKKHTYHEYGTLISDVWRDIECDPSKDKDIDRVLARISDLFGLDPYNHLYSVDLRTCSELLPITSRMEEMAHSKLDAINSVPVLESRLINADSIEAMKSLPANSVDFCFADPPYNLKKKYDKWDDALESVEYFEWCDKWLFQLFRLLKPGRTLAVLNIPLWAVRHFRYLSSISDYQAWIVWEALGFPVRMIMPAHYTIICFSKGVPRPLPGVQIGDNDIFNGQQQEYISPLEESHCLRASCINHRRRLGKSDRSRLNDIWHDIHRLKHNSRRVDHPCQLPPLLMRRIFALFTKPGEIILDCFNGAGTSTLVAQQMERRFIGIELSSQYHEIASRRHKQVTLALDPFGKMDTVPTTKNSPVQRLPKQKYQITKKALQLEVKRIATIVGHLPSREEVERLSKYPYEYFDKYFISWGEVCAAARTTGMSENPVAAKDLSQEDKQLQMCLVSNKS